MIILTAISNAGAGLKEYDGTVLLLEANFRPLAIFLGVTKDSLIPFSQPLS